jgi:acid stress-induced BolA-like protein IbaG/YrbA
VDLKEKLTEALRRSLRPDHIRLENDGGISGFVVSAQFQRMPSLERQMLIDKALRQSSLKITKAEFRQILAIAALTPAEYEALGYKDREIRR